MDLQGLCQEYVDGHSASDAPKTLAQSKLILILRFYIMLTL